MAGVVTKHLFDLIAKQVEDQMLVGGLSKEGKRKKACDLAIGNILRKAMRMPHLKPKISTRVGGSTTTMAFVPEMGVLAFGR